MRPAFRASVVGFAALLACVPCFAQQVYTIGLGTNSCGKWLEATNKQVPRAQYRDWLLGFVTGANWYTTGEQAKVPDSVSAVAFIDQYCRNNPLHMVALAAAALVQESGGPKALHDWKR